MELCRGPEGRSIGLFLATAEGREADVWGEVDVGSEGAEVVGEETRPGVASMSPFAPRPTLAMEGGFALATLAVSSVPSQVPLLKLDAYISVVDPSASPLSAEASRLPLPSPPTGLPSVLVAGGGGAAPGPIKTPSIVSASFGPKLPRVRDPMPASPPPATDVDADEERERVSSVRIDNEVASGGERKESSSATIGLCGATLGSSFFWPSTSGVWVERKAGVLPPLVSKEAKESGRAEAPKGWGLAAPAGMKLEGGVIVGGVEGDGDDRTLLLVRASGEIGCGSGGTSLDKRSVACKKDKSKSAYTFNARLSGLKCPSVAKVDVNILLTSSLSESTSGPPAPTSFII